MSSLFSDNDKTAIEEVIDDIHDTFKRDIYAYVDIPSYSSFNSDHNPLYDRNNNESLSLPERKQYTIQARVHYERWNPDDVDNDTNLPTSENIVRLKVKKDDYEILKKAATIEVDGANYSLNTDNLIEGSLLTGNYTVYARRDT